MRTTIVTIDRAGIPVLADLAEKIGIHLGKESRHRTGRIAR